MGLEKGCRIKEKRRALFNGERGHCGKAQCDRAQGTPSSWPELHLLRSSHGNRQTVKTQYSDILLPSSHHHLDSEQTGRLLKAAVKAWLGSLWEAEWAWSLSYRLCPLSHHKGNRKGLSTHPQTRNEHVEASERPDFKSKVLEYKSSQTRCTSDRQNKNPVRGTRTLVWSSAVRAVMATEPRGAGR